MESNGNVTTEAIAEGSGNVDDVFWLVIPHTAVAVLVFSVVTQVPDTAVIAKTEEHMGVFVAAQTVAGVAMGDDDPFGEV